MSAISLPSPPADPQSPSIPCASVEGASPVHLGVLIPFLSSDFQLLAFNFQSKIPTRSGPSLSPNFSSKLHHLPNSFPLNPFADPHPLNLVPSILYKNMGGAGRRSVVQTFRHADVSHLHKSFRCNTYRPPRKCCKQTTYGPPKPFRCNTYKKTGGRGPFLFADNLNRSLTAGSCTNGRMSPFQGEEQSTKARERCASTICTE